MTQMTEEEKRNVAAIKALGRLVNEGRLDEIDELFTEDYRDNNHGWQVETVAELKPVIVDAQERLEFSNVLEDMIVSGDKAVIRLTNQMRHVSKVFGMEPTGEALSMQAIEIFRFEDGKIAERWVVADHLTMMRKLGVAVPPM